jgi:hypothetical protein
VIKRTKKESDREEKTQIVAESVKTEQLTKIDFFEDILLLKSKKKLIKVLK